MGTPAEAHTGMIVEAHDGEPSVVLPPESAEERAAHVAHLGDRAILFTQHLQSRFDDMTDERCDVFDLWPLDDATFALAREDWEIWLRWQQAFHEGRATIESHPALPQDRPRHEELERLLEGRLPPATPPATQRSGEFQQELVRWSPVPTGNAPAGA